MRTTLTQVAVVLATLAAFHASGIAGSQTTPTQRPVPSSAERRAIMRNHYSQVTEIHDAIIRGDLKAVAAPARKLANQAPATPVPTSLTAFVTAMKARATKVADATTIAAAAKATTELLSECAGCHRAAGVRPAPPSRDTPDVGGVVGHMLAHQHATDALLLGLLLPSQSEWELGAGLLDTGELRPSELPRDSKLVGEARKADETIHALARPAAAAAGSASRQDEIYASVVTACAQCHGLHPNIWGPSSK